jgi:glycyl-radical enzyme activating protein family
MTQGTIFNIQKFSIHDGPGIRTTVFLKGCPLKCQWCANPESQLAQVQILYDFSKCSHCLTCVKTCLHQAIDYIDHRIKIDSSQCKGCLVCVQSCLNRALSHEGNHKTVDEVVKICLQDLDFYQESNGGVTISGGEGFSQPQFVEELVKELKRKHIHVAIETTGYTDSSVFQKLAPLFDLLLFDVKHYQRERHYEGTGVDNALILANLKCAIEQGIEVLPRIPVIPKFNDSLEDAYGFSQLLKSIGISKVQLLPFHQFGERKYELLNLKYAYQHIKALYPEDLKDYRQIFIQEGLDCFF